jgi:simple sugar transport system substrate-binding protein
MNAKKLLSILVLVTLMGVVLLGCSTPAAETPVEEVIVPEEEEPVAEEPEAEAEPYEIAVIVKITGIPWFNRMEEGVDQAAKDFNVNAYQVGPADADPAQQAKIVEDMISKGVDAIAVVPNDATALEPVFKKAQEAGIIVLTHESPDQVGNDYDLELIDNEEFGRHHWDMLVENMGDTGQYAIFVGGLTVPLHNLWADVGLEYAAEKYPGLELVTERIPCGEDQDLSRQKTLELLQSYPDLKGIIGFGSLGPPGAAQALEEKGLIEEVAVVGTVLPGHAAPYLQSGAMDHGILWDPKDAGYSLVWTALQLLEGNEITDGMDVPGVGAITLDGNVIKVDAMLDITAENAEELGF